MLNYRTFDRPLFITCFVCTQPYSATGGPKAEKYAVEIELYGEINVEDSKQMINTQKIFCTMMKKEAGA
jgi:hypothetical protein